MNKEQVQEKVKEKRIKKALKSYRFRPFKNFLFWFAGVVALPFVLVVSALIGLKVVPISSYLALAPQSEEQYVSEELANKSIIDALASWQQLKVGDLPVLETFIEELLIETGAGDYVEVDYDKLKTVNFFHPTDGETTLVEAVSECIIVTATVESMNMQYHFGDLNKTDAFKWEPVPSSEVVDPTAEGFNAKLYYYDSTDEGEGGNTLMSMVMEEEQERKYSLAFEVVEVDGEKVIQMVEQARGKQLYYANLAKVSILDVLSLIEDRVSKLKITSLFDMFLPENTLGEYDTLVYSLLNGVTIGDLLTIEDASFFLDKIKVGDILGDKLEKFNALSTFNWTEVPLDQTPDFSVEENKPNAKIYYYLASDGENPVYERAYTDDNVLVEGASGKTLYYANLMQIPLSQVLEVFTDVLNKENIDNVLSILSTDVGIVADIFKGKTIGDLLNLTDATELLNNVVLAELLSEGSLGDFDGIEIFTWREVDVEVDPTAAKFNNKLYYYLDGEEYKLAFDQENNLLAPSGASLYYANLKQVPLGEALDIIGARFNVMKIDGLLDIINSNGSEEEQTGLLYDLLSGQTIGGLVEMTDATALLEKISIQTLGGVEILGDLSKLDLFTWAVASDVDPTSEDFDYKQYYYYDGDDTATEKEDDLFKLAFDENGQRLAPTGKQLYYANLAVVPFTHFTELLSASFNRLKVVDMISQLATPIDPDSLIAKVLGDKTLKQINDVGSDIYVDWVLPYGEENKGIYKIILSARGESWADDVELEQLAKDLMIDSLSFDVNNIKLSSVMDESSKIFEILNGANVDVNGDGITIGELQNFDANNLQLSVVLDVESNKTLYEILLENKGISYTDSDFNDKAEALTVGDLSFDVSNIKLSTVMKGNENQMLVDVFNDAFAVGYENVKVSDLSSFDIGGVKLKTVLGEESTGNPILDALIDTDCTLNNVGSAINSISLYEVYGKNCFISATDENVESEKYSQSPKYKAVYDSDGKLLYYEQVADDQNVEGEEYYYIHAGNGVWLLMCFEGQEYKDTTIDVEGVAVPWDSDGRPSKYYLSDLTVATLQQAQELSTRFNQATLRQLVDAGILESTLNDEICWWTIADLLNFVTSGTAPMQKD